MCTLITVILIIFHMNLSFFSL